jgi:hypothetical protein
MKHVSLKTVLKKSVDAFIEENGRLSSRYSSYVYKEIDGSIIKHINDACYSALKYKSDVVTELIVYQHRATVGTKREHLDFMRWMLNKSPWNKVFLTKNAAEAYNNGFSIDICADTTVVYAALIAMRQFSEFKGFALSYSLLRGKGYCPSVSYITAQFIYGGKEPYYRGFIVDNHTVLTGDQDIQRFMREVKSPSGFPGRQRAFYRYSPVYGGVHSLIEKGKAGECLSNYSSFFKMKNPKDILELARKVKREYAKL